MQSFEHPKATGAPRRRRQHVAPGGRHVLRHAIAMSVLAAAPFASAAAPSGEAEEIVVTGSYIKRDNFDLPSPVSVVTAAEIEASATTNLADVLFNQPQNLGIEVLANPGASGTSASSLRTAGGAQGGIGLANLRGLGARSTMTLLDGHRLVFGDANFTYPQIAVERIETLLDGASALYGSEAIAGAVNYIPKKTFDGVDVTIERRDLDDFSAPDHKLGILAGSEGERTSVMFALEVRERERLEQREFEDYARKSFLFNQSGSTTATATFPGVSRLALRQTGAAGQTNTGAPRVLFDTQGRPISASSTFLRADPGCGHSFMNPSAGAAVIGTSGTLGTSTYREYHDPTVPGAERWGIPQLGEARIANRTTCGLSFGEYLDYNAELRQTHGYARFEHALSDDLTFEADVIYGKQAFNTRANPTPLVTIDPLRVPGDLPGNPFVAFIDRNNNGLPDDGERLHALDNCNFYDCTAGDGLPDRGIDRNGDGQPDDLNGDGLFTAADALPLVQGNPTLDGNGIPLYPVLLAAGTTATSDRFTDGPGRVRFNEDVTLSNTTLFGKNLQGLPTRVNSDGSVDRGREVTNLRLGTGVRYAIPDTSWEASLYYTYGTREQNYALAFGSPFNLSSRKLQAAFTCVNPKSATNPRGQDCLQFNPFATSQFPIVDMRAQNSLTPDTDPAFNTAEEVNALIAPNLDRTVSTSRIVDLILTGELFDLPMGAVSAAVGGHYRIETSDIIPGNLNELDENAFGTSILPFDGDTESTDAFAELRIPLLDSNLFGTAEVQVAGRYTKSTNSARIGLGSDADYDDFVRKVAALWQPTDWMSVRASWGEGFIAPLLSETSGQRREATRTLADPECNIIRPIQIAGCAYTSSAGNATVIGYAVTEAFQGNPDLVAETSDAYNVGVTLKLLDNDLTLQADWFTVEFRDTVNVFGTGEAGTRTENAFLPFYINFMTTCLALPTGQTYVERTISTATNPATIPATEVACAVDARNAFLASDAQNPRFTRDAVTGVITDYEGEIANTTSVDVTSVDVLADYRFESTQIPILGDQFGDFGDFGVRINGTYFKEYEFQLTRDGAVLNGVGGRNDDGGGSQVPPVPRWRATGTLSWNLGDHSARLTGRYHSAVSDLNRDGTTNARNLRGHIRAATYWDLFYSYDWNDLFGPGRVTRFSVGFQNVFDFEPPPIEDGGGVDTNLDSPLGRLVTLRINQRL
jgi:outer membrane receptor protein involved in Fe transport